LCDVEQRSATENINLTTLSSGESISPLICLLFNQYQPVLADFSPSGLREAAKARIAIRGRIVIRKIVFMLLFCNKNSRIASHLSETFWKAGS